MPFSVRLPQLGLTASAIFKEHLKPTHHSGFVDSGFRNSGLVEFLIRDVDLVEQLVLRLESTPASLVRLDVPVGGVVLLGGAVVSGCHGLFDRGAPNADRVTPQGDKVQT